MTVRNHHQVIPLKTKLTTRFQKSSAYALEEVQEWSLTAEQKNTVLFDQGFDDILSSSIFDGEASI